MVPLLVEAFAPVSYGVEIPDCKGLCLVWGTEDAQGASRLSGHQAKVLFLLL